MTQESGQKSWWVTLPGILTQLVALVTALTGLVAALYQTGVFHHQENAPTQDMAASSSAGEVGPSPAPQPHNGVNHIASPPTPAPPPTSAPSPKGAFAIKIGDTISEGVPTPGAGKIESPGTEDVYHFSATANQRVYFRMLEHGANMSYIKWRLTDQDDQEVFNTCLGCGEPGMKTLAKGGTYRLTVGNMKDPATGAYKLDLTTP